MAAHVDNCEAFSATGSNIQCYSATGSNIQIGHPPKNNCNRHHNDVPNTTVIIFNINSI